MTLYLDTSALAKLVRVERESESLRERLTGTTLVSSAIARTELGRVATRLGEEYLAVAERVLDGLDSVSVTRSRLDRAGRLLPAGLRSPDAIHLVTALELRDELDAFVAYDSRLLAAAHQHALPTASPS